MPSIEESECLGLVQPSSRKQSTSLNATTLQFDLNCPQGKYVHGIKLHLHTNATATGTGTAYLSTFIRDLIVKNEFNERFIYATGGRPLQAAALLAATKMGKDKVQLIDVVVAASATDYDAKFQIWAPMNGSKFTVFVGINAATALTGLTVSAITNDVDVDLIVGDTPLEARALEAYQKTDTSVDEGPCYDALIGITNVELSGRLSSLEFGGQVLSTDQIKDLENYLANRANGMGPATGTANTNVYEVPIVMGHATNIWYAVMMESKDLTRLRAQASASSTFDIALFTEVKR